MRQCGAPRRNRQLHADASGSRAAATAALGRATDALVAGNQVQRDGGDLLRHHGRRQARRGAARPA
ncbi:MAG: hypothetical protein MZV49_13020 [Rhodopseudomonas palustris]|nr:hypothetical protein [Rhodopseudomonas palustris]